MWVYMGYQRSCYLLFNKKKSSQETTLKEESLTMLFHLMLNDISSFQLKKKKQRNAYSQETTLKEKSSTSHN